MRRANLSKHLYGLFIFICVICLLIGFPLGRAQAIPPPAPDSLSVLYSFGTVSKDGNYPTGNLTLSGSTLYGMAGYGGANAGTSGYGNGAIFQVNTNGSGYKVLYSFGSVANDGVNPSGSLTLSGSTLYGMTPSGGANGSGTIFQINTNGKGYKVLYSFGTVTNDGANPNGSLTLSGSTLYGMTSQGGTNGLGTIFQINATTGYQVLYNFAGYPNDGANPNGSLTLSLSGSTLYGMTSQGGAYYGGTIFQISTNGSGYQVLYSFGGVANDGTNPGGSLSLSGSTLYGMTTQGGAYTSVSASNSGFVGNGTIFSFSLGGTVDQVLYSFAGYPNDGNNPYGDLTLSGSTLYGMTPWGGANGYNNGYGYGTIFQINTDGTGYLDLYSFTGGSDGMSPLGSFTLSGSKLYGMTSSGGADGNGAIFSMGTATLAVPAAPTGIMAAAGVAQAAVSFTPPAYYVGPPITSYTVTPYIGTTAQTPVGPVTASPVIVPGLNNGTAYTFEVTATNYIGNSLASGASNSVTPSEAPIPSELVATWNFNSFPTGSSTDPDVPSYNSFTEAIAQDGTFTISQGGSEIANGNLWIFPNGTVPVIMIGGVNVVPNMLCQINSDQTVVVCTDTLVDGTGSTELNIGTKQAASYATADFAGNWEGYLLISGPTPGSGTMSETLDSAGNITNGTLTINGTETSITGQMLMAAGVVTCSPSSSGCLSNYTGFMDAGKTVVVGTSGLSISDSDAELSFFIKKAASYSMADLAGTWRANQLESGPDAPYWERNTITISSTGTFTGSYTDSNGETGSSTGKLSISPTTGALKCVSGSCSGGGGGSMPVMDTSKTVMVSAKTSSDGSGKIMIFTKNSAAIPEAPTTGTATAGPGSGEATVNFTAPVSDGGSPITGYTVTSSPGGKKASGPATATSIIVKGLTNGDSYTFTVMAVNKIGIGPASSPSNPPVTPGPLPVAPANVTATATGGSGSGEAKVNFTVTAADSGDTYTVTPSPDPGSVTGTGAGSPILVSGLTPGDSYTFTVTATNSIGSTVSKASKKITLP
ncbi:MAG: choice-of-anchor tandem repeat GloVer-containing protein [Syntrophobacteraceae bacterium]